MSYCPGGCWNGDNELQIIEHSGGGKQSDFSEKKKKGKKKAQKIVNTIQLQDQNSSVLIGKRDYSREYSNHHHILQADNLISYKILKLWKLNVKRQNCYRNSVKTWRRNFQKLTLFACYLKLHIIISAAQRTSTLDCFPSYCDATSLQA